MREFGIEKSYVENFEFVESKKYVRITSKDYLKEACLLGAVSGLKIFRKGAMLNPTSNFVFVFGRKIRKRKIELSLEELKEFLEKGRIKKKSRRKGYVLVAYRGRAVALGFSRKNEIECFMPKEFRRQVLDALKGACPRK